MLLTHNKMYEAKPSRKQIILGVILFSLVMIWIIYGVIQRFKLAQNHLYTIGVTEGRRSTHKGTVIDYSFYYKHQKYKSSKHLAGQNPKEIDGRYYVKFLPSNPFVNDIYWSKPVSKNIKIAPIDGWEKIPE